MRVKVTPGDLMSKLDMNSTMVKQMQRAREADDFMSMMFPAINQVQAALSSRQRPLPVPAEQDIGKLIDHSMVE